MPSFWGRVGSIGVDAQTPPGQARTVALVNVLAVLSAALTLGWVPLALRTGAYEILAMNVLQAAATAGALLINQRRHHYAATVYLATATLVCLLTQSLWAFGWASRAHYFLLPSAIIPFLAFAPQHSRSAWFFALTSVLAFLLVDQLGYLAPPPLSRIAIDDPSVVALNMAFLAAVLVVAGAYSRKTTLHAEAEAEQQRQRSETLLLNVLPAPIAERLKQGEPIIADGHDDVTILFSDVVGFTSLSERIPPEELVNVLNDLFSEFDHLADRYQLEKIKTIGDAYMVVGGLRPDGPSGKNAAAAVVHMGLEMQRAIALIALRVGHDLRIRIGINTGRVVAGVIGKRKFAYDLWGDAVNTAARMESSGIAGKIQVTAATHQLLQGAFNWSARGPIEIKGKGTMDAFLLDSE